MNTRGLGLVLLVSFLWPLISWGQVSFDRILRADQEPQNWLTYSGTTLSHRHSLLNQINAANVKNLELQWIYQARSLEKFEATALVVDGVMYTVQAPNDVIALDAATGRVFWIFSHAPEPWTKPCCGHVNRGLAILGDTLFMATIDAHLIAIDAKNGRPLWDTTVADAKSGYALTLAPLVVKDKVIVGTAGGDYGIRGFIAAYDVHTGKEVWRFYTIPEPGGSSWGGDSWQEGGGPVWITGSYDPALNLSYWGTGNPSPDYDGDSRPGDNLYTDSVVALDPDTGKLKWYYQFSPHDEFDWDSTQVPVLADLNLSGSAAKVMLWANRNGFFYVLDRATGRFLLGRPFVKVNWASDLDERGRPIQTPQPVGLPTWPGNQGGTNWYSPSFSPRTGLFYVSAWEDYATLFGERVPNQYVEGRSTVGAGGRSHVPVKGARPLPALGRGPINNWTEAAGHGAVKAIDPQTGKEAWKFYTTDVSAAGILTTASDLLFTGGREGYFQVLDARNGALLWKTNLGAQIVNGPIAYEVDRKQYVVTIAGLSLVAFGLRE